MQSTTCRKNNADTNNPTFSAIVVWQILSIFHLILLLKTHLKFKFKKLNQILNQQVLDKFAP